MIYYVDRRFRESEHLFLIEFEDRQTALRFVESAGLDSYVSASQMELGLKQIEALAAKAERDGHSLRSEQISMAEVDAAYIGRSKNEAFVLQAARNGRTLYLMAAP